MNNYGDDLFSIACIHGAQRWWNDLHPRILAPTSNGIEEYASITSATLCQNFSRLDFAGKTIRTAAALSELLNNRRLVFGGGSLFSKDRSKAFEVLNLIPLPRKKELAAIGVSIAPFDSISSERTLVHFLKKFSYISVRDEASLHRLERYKLDATISFGYDLIGVLDNITPKPISQHDQHIVGFSSCNLGANSFHADRFDSQFVEAAKRHPNILVRIFNLNDHPKIGDTDRNYRVLRALHENGIKATITNYSAIGPLATWKQISECDSMASIRLHGAISAYLTGVPFVLFEYQNKCTDFLNDIGQDALMRIPTISANLQIDDTLYSSAFTQLFTEPIYPRLPCNEFSEGSCKHFTRAPWADNDSSQAAIL